MNNILGSKVSGNFLIIIISTILEELDKSNNFILKNAKSKFDF